MQAARGALYQQGLNQEKTHPRTEHDAVDVQQDRHGTGLSEGSAQIKGRRKSGEHRDNYGGGHDDEEKPQP
jgi:hypothetical protein